VPSHGVGAVNLAVAALIGSGLVLLPVAYQLPANSVIIAAASTRIDRTTAIAVIAAGLIWVCSMSALRASSASGPAGVRFWRRHDPDPPDPALGVQSHSRSDAAGSVITTLYNPR